MSLKKQYLKSKPICKVTFQLSDQAVANAGKVNLTGDFNNWDTQSLPMRKVKKGEFTTTIELEKDKQYQYKFIIDDQKWLHDNDADKVITNEFMTQNSLIFV